MSNYKTITSEDEKKAKRELESRKDAEGLRLKRFLNMPDLSRTKGSPLAELVERIVSIPRFADFEILQVPEVVPYDISFDLFDFPKDHPARSVSDTYFVDKDHILRTHTTVMWYYHLGLSEVMEKIKKGEPVGALSFGKVYRKDEIDRNHMNVFHQIDGWYLCRKKDKIIGAKDLENVLAEIAKTIFGNNVKYRFNEDQFPYTDPSLEMEVERPSAEVDLPETPESEIVSGPKGDKQNSWVELLGAGVVSGKVLKKLGVDPEEYNGWAFGFGIERLAIVSMELPDIRLLWSQDERVKKQLKLGQKYQEVSKYPPITRDISFIVKKDFTPNNYFDLIRDLGGDLVEEVKLLDSYENESKFGSGMTSYTYRIIYRSNERTLTTDEIDPIQDKIYKETAKQFKAELR